MSNLFENITEKQKEKIYHLLKTTTIYYPKNVNILSNAKKGDFIGIIEEGKAELIYNDFAGNQTIINVLEKDSIFGSPLTNINIDEIICITKEKTKITYIEYERITDMENIKYEYYINFIKNLLILLGEQLKEKNERIEILTQKTTRNKLLQFFKITSLKKGSRTFNLTYSFTELANYLSVDRSAMTRELKYLKQEGFIKIYKKKVTLNFV